MRATVEEMKKEAMLRLELLKVSNKTSMYPEAFKNIPVTCFNGEFARVTDIHCSVLEEFQKYAKGCLPFYITESWHGCDIISVLYISAEKDLWEEEREGAKDGYHPVFAYSVNDRFGEFGEAIFGIEEDVLWRIG